MACGGVQSSVPQLSRCWCLFGIKSPSYCGETGKSLELGANHPFNCYPSSTLTIPANPLDIGWAAWWLRPSPPASLPGSIPYTSAERGLLASMLHCWYPTQQATRTAGCCLWVACYQRSGRTPPVPWRLQHAWQREVYRVRLILAAHKATPSSRVNTGFLGCAAVPPI